MNKNINYNKRACTDGNPKYRLSEDEANVIKQYRRLKEEAEAAGIDINDVKHGWVKSQNSSLFFTNPSYRREEKNEFFEDMLKTFQEHIPNYEKIEYESNLKNHCLVLDPADIHIGKIASVLETGQEYNSQEAVIRVQQGVKSILSKCKSFPLDKIVLVLGNDVLHFDTPNKTTKGTLVDSDDKAWFEIFLIAKRLYVDVIEKLKNVAQVHVVYCPSNHDLYTSFYLAQLIETHFKNCLDVTFDSSPAYRKYYTYKNNLFGFTHGDKAKTNDLPLLMATECAEDWAKCNRRYIYTHHIHSKYSKDFLKVTVESLRSPSSPDSWHHAQGYLNMPAVEGFIHNENGQIARITHFF